MYPLKYAHGLIIYTYTYIYISDAFRQYTNYKLWEEVINRLPNFNGAVGNGYRVMSSCTLLSLWLIIHATM